MDPLNIIGLFVLMAWVVDGHGYNKCKNPKGKLGKVRKEGCNTFTCLRGNKRTTWVKTLGKPPCCSFDSQSLELGQVLTILSREGHSLTMECVDRGGGGPELDIAVLTPVRGETDHSRDCGCNCNCNCNCNSGVNECDATVAATPTMPTTATAAAGNRSTISTATTTSTLTTTSNSTLTTATTTTATTTIATTPDTTTTATKTSTTVNTATKTTPKTSRAPTTTVTTTTATTTTPTPATSTTTSTTVTTTTAKISTPTTTTSTTTSTTVPITVTTTTASTVTTITMIKSSITEGGVGGSYDYCLQGSDHTMCLYQGPSLACSAKLEDRELTEAAKQDILDRHNEMRRKIAQGKETSGSQPPASNMRKLKWNDEIAATAQRWTDQCMFEHDTNRNKEDGTWVGQNMYFKGSSNKKDKNTLMTEVGNEATLSWYNEVISPGFSNAHINPFVFNLDAGHYTQVVWADTEEIGCGWTYYAEKVGPFLAYKSLTVCNYARGGNAAHRPMYLAGPACTNCPSGYECQDHLCTK